MGNEACELKTSISKDTEEEEIKNENEIEKTNVKDEIEDECNMEIKESKVAKTKVMDEAYELKTSISKDTEEEEIKNENKVVKTNMKDETEDECKLEIKQGEKVVKTKVIDESCELKSSISKYLKKDTE